MVTTMCIRGYFNFLLLQQPMVHIVSSRLSSPAEVWIRMLSSQRSSDARYTTDYLRFCESRGANKILVSDKLGQNKVFSNEQQKNRSSEACVSINERSRRYNHKVPILLCRKSALKIHQREVRASPKFRSKDNIFPRHYYGGIVS